MVYLKFLYEHTLETEDYIAVSLLTTSCHVILFAISRQYVVDSRRLSSMVSLTNSFVMLCLGFAFICVHLIEGVNIFSLQPDQGGVFEGRSNFSEIVCTIFATSCVLNLVIGFIFYSKHTSRHIFGDVLNLLEIIFLTTGNIVIVKYHRPFSNAMMWLLIEELPVFIFSLGTYLPSFRSDIGYGLSFFLTSILFHAHIVIQAMNLKIPAIIGIYYTSRLFTNIKMFLRWCKTLGKVKYKREKVKQS